MLDVSTPISLPHLASSHQNGALMIHLHTAPLKAVTNKLKQQMSVGFLVALGVLLAALMLILKQWTLKPLQQILAVTDARNKGHKVFSHVETQDEFLTLSNAFNEMVRTGDELELQKNRFVATVSHELRTPLTSIKGGLAILLNQYEKSLDPKALEMLSIALRNTERLRVIINDLLDMEKINADQLILNKKCEDLVKVIRNALADCENYASTCKVSFAFINELPSAFVNIDKARIQQVLLNLLSNAAKFSPEDSKVEVTLEQHDEYYKISVKDYGCGIPESFRSDIFKSFKQADNSSSRAKGGTGLGLAISNKLLALHGTTLEFTSVVNQGACFFFEIKATSINEAS